MQVGKPRDIYENPNCKFVAEFIGTSNFLPGTVSQPRAATRSTSTTEAGGSGSCRRSDAGRREGDRRHPARGPRDQPDRLGQPAERVGGHRDHRAFLGDAVDHIVRVGEGTLRVRGNPALSIEPGSEVYLSTDPDKVTLVPVD